MYSIRIAAVVLALSPASLVGQLQGPYLLSSGDTLTYREVSIGSVQIQTPQGMVAVGSTHDALISMTPGDGDRIAAWYSSLELGSSGPEGDVTPATDALLGRHYELVVTNHGDVATASAPEAPPEVQQITDLSHQFDDFLIRVPTDRPSEGSTWADTLSSSTSAIPNVTQLHRAVRSYTARGDTTLHGRVVQIIEMSVRVELESTSPMEGAPGVNVTTELSGSEVGRAFFDWEAGQLVGREKEGRLEGVFRVLGPQTIEFPQTMEYDSTIEWVSANERP